MSAHEMGCSSGVGQRCTCKAIRAERQPRPRDCSALFVNGACVVCTSTDCTEAHAVIHLSEGTAVVQMAKGDEHWALRILPTSDVPLQDESGISVFEHDGDKFDRTDVNAENLRAAYAKARALNRDTKRRIAAAAKGHA